MPASLVTGWKRIAQSGETVDGRFIKADWLTDMAENYDPDVYTAKLWIDHMRYASYGSVRELKAEQDGDLVRLYAKISPTRPLLQMNQVWEEHLHFSIEPTEDFAKTGKCYLTGLGMTDSPASLGTDEMRFSKISGRTFTARYPGEVVPDLREPDDDKQVESFMRKLAMIFSKTNKPKKKEEPMDEQQLKEFKEAIAGLQQTMTGVADSINNFVSGQTSDKGDGADTPDTDTAPPAPAADNQFAELKTRLDALTGKFDQIIARIEKTPAGTQFSDTTQPADDQDGII
ncbi:MAG: GPO family capsid scaffolding protein [Desulfobacter sp.]|nr:GPO family capsid scaffolding protein [Desulfobacter sp.]